MNNIHYRDGKSDKGSNRKSYIPHQAETHLECFIGEVDEAFKGVLS